MRPFTDRCASVPAISKLPEDPTIGQLRRAITERDEVIRFKDKVIRALQASQQLAKPAYDLRSLAAEEKDEIIKVLTKLCLQLSAPKLPEALFPSVRGLLSLTGGLYEGELVAGQPHGKGVMRLDSGAVYEGDWIAGKKSGTGVFKWPSGASFAGEWRDGKRHGRGRYLAPEGVDFEGFYREDKKQGLGLVRLAKGHLQLAAHEDGRLNGLSLELNSDRSTIWLKEFKDDKLVGEWRRFQLAEINAV